MYKRQDDGFNAVRLGQVGNRLHHGNRPNGDVYKRQMKNLRMNGYIEMDPDGSITLLDKGREIAEKIYERHTLLSDWLTILGVSPEVAVEDACRIEHVISDESFRAIKAHAEKYKQD